MVSIHSKPSNQREWMNGCHAHLKMKKKVVKTLTFIKFLHVKVCSRQVYKADNRFQWSWWHTTHVFGFKFVRISRHNSTERARQMWQRKCNRYACAVDFFDRFAVKKVWSTLVEKAVFLWYIGHRRISLPVTMGLQRDRASRSVVGSQMWESSISRIRIFADRRFECLAPFLRYTRRYIVEWRLRTRQRPPPPPSSFSLSLVELTSFSLHIALAHFDSHPPCICCVSAEPRSFVLDSTRFVDFDSFPLDRVRAFVPSSIQFLWLPPRPNLVFPFSQQSNQSNSSQIRNQRLFDHRFVSLFCFSV